MISDLDLHFLPMYLVVEDMYTYIPVNGLSHEVAFTSDCSKSVFLVWSFFVRLYDYSLLCVFCFFFGPV